MRYGEVLVILLGRSLEACFLVLFFASVPLCFATVCCVL